MTLLSYKTDENQGKNSIPFMIKHLKKGMLSNYFPDIQKIFYKNR